MIRSVAFRRRLLAGLMLCGFAVGSALFWNNWQLDWALLGINLLVAIVGFGFLHVRWRLRERRAMTPRRIKDIFS